MQTPKPVVFRGVLEQSPYLMKYSKGHYTAGEHNSLINTNEDSQID